MAEEPGVAFTLRMRCARRSFRSAWRRRFGAAKCVAVAPSNVVTRLARPRSKSTSLPPEQARILGSGSLDLTLDRDPPIPSVDADGAAKDRPSDKHSAELHRPDLRQAQTFGGTSTVGRALDPERLAGHAE